MVLHFTATESTFSYFEATRSYIERHGKPGALYSDKYSVFRNVNPGKTGNSVTHFGRAMYELNIDTFCANSSPAKGRVERAHLGVPLILMHFTGVGPSSCDNALRSAP